VAAAVNVSIVIWCDDASHPRKRSRVFVAEFTKPNIMWAPMPQKRRTPGVKWWSDRGERAHVEPDAGENALLHHDLTCRYCKRPLTVRPGKMDAILDQIQAAGRVYVTMAELRAILNTSGQPRP
jgi:hypothetical protein